MDNKSIDNKETKEQKAFEANILLREYTNNDRAIYVLSQAEDYALNLVVDKLTERQTRIRKIILTAIDPDYFGEA
ncbi:MAG: hypothetical protein WC262_13205 [Bacteroidales bacterium]|jgi:hypothetical protein